MILPCILIVGALAAAAAYASPCTPSPSPPGPFLPGGPADGPGVDAATTRGGPKPVPVVKPSLPSIPGATELSPPPANTSLLKIALGHGIQNYTCTDSASTPTALGALAVLYDATALYPGTPGTGLDDASFGALSAAILWTQALPLNLVNAAAAGGPPGTRARDYGADATNPFPAPADARLPGPPLAGPDPDPILLPFLGHHFFDATGTPVFQLPAAGLSVRVAKKEAVDAPAGSDRGVLGTGSVAWLRLAAINNSAHQDVSLVYRVVTAGGNAQPCSVAGQGPESVPYAAFYWFYR